MCIPMTYAPRRTEQSSNAGSRGDDVATVIVPAWTPALNPV